MEGLKSDLSRLETGWNPSRDDLTDSAPLLEGWGIWDSGEVLPRIVGFCAGASKIGSFYEEGEQVVTLQILAIDHRFAWVRDRRGFYRLADCQLPRRAILGSQ
ncbi:hypothetical protein [Bosea sp. TAF32]|uniref:hypothetical protein n=1 Tax=Bosea sp. TAF32 TaxID=3237482 RepID=UPI003F914EBE